MNNDLPFTYAVVRGDETLAVVPYRATAEDWAFISKCKVVPLYRRQQPTLTDEEREAVELAEYTMRQVENGPCDEAADTLRKMLERLEGEQ